MDFFGYEKLRSSSHCKSGSLEFALFSDRSPVTQPLEKLHQVTLRCNWCFSKTVNTSILRGLMFRHFGGVIGCVCLLRKGCQDCWSKCREGMAIINYGWEVNNQPASRDSKES